LALPHRAIGLHPARGVKYKHNFLACLPGF
jgi:hypothetical protein